ncbi:hypothetical protein QJS83_17060 [Bdellovibrio sp. 22V]|uniref:hypothetical protein n=1 Tax=Bdellovibrio sp. 22V TaxID=3044166 RepID=UPI0025437073|nr:hypothetical protein [Bdellovibrio sp. 22V]WII72175.1 hypothetical protein QJS83_17060 [Bdellovibrio sp. 22V]
MNKNLKKFEVFRSSPLTYGSHLRCALDSIVFSERDDLVEKEYVRKIGKLVTKGELTFRKMLGAFIQAKTQRIKRSAKVHWDFINSEDINSFESLAKLIACGNSFGDQAPRASRLLSSFLHIGGNFCVVTSSGTRLLSRSEITVVLARFIEMLEFSNLRMSKFFNSSSEEYGNRGSTSDRIRKNISATLLVDDTALDFIKDLQINDATNVIPLEAYRLRHDWLHGDAPPGPLIQLEAVRLSSAKKNSTKLEEEFSTLRRKFLRSGRREENCCEYVWKEACVTYLNIAMQNFGGAPQYFSYWKAHRDSILFFHLIELRSFREYLLKKQGMPLSLYLRSKIFWKNI